MSPLESRARAGDRDAWAQVWALHRPAMVRAALRVLHHREDAEDAASNAFLNAMRAFHRFRDGSMHNWLCVCAHRAAQDILRHRRAMPFGLDMDPWCGPADGADALGAALRAESGREVRRATRHLTRRPRRAVGLLLAGASQSDIAVALGCPVGSVKSALHEARRQLKPVLERRGVIG